MKLKIASKKIASRFAMFANISTYSAFLERKGGTLLNFILCDMTITLLQRTDLFLNRFYSVSQKCIILGGLSTNSSVIASQKVYFRVV